MALSFTAATAMHDQATAELRELVKRIGPDGVVATRDLCALIRNEPTQLAALGREVAAGSEEARLLLDLILDAALLGMAEAVKSIIEELETPT